MLKTITIPERTRNIVLAVAVAAFAAMLTAFYVSNYKRHVQQDQQNVPVLVAKRKIDTGTPGREAVSKGLAAVETLPRRRVVTGSFSSVEQLQGLVAAEDVYPGEQVTARRFRPLEERGVRSKLDGNLRAIEVAGTRHDLLAGTLKEGDHTDVVANFKLESTAAGSNFSFTRLILRDILVLRAPSGGDDSAVGGSDDEAKVQLALTDSQAQKLFYAEKNGEWALTLRPVNNSADSPESVETLWTTLRDGLREPKIRKAFFGAAIAR